MNEFEKQTFHDEVFLTLSTYRGQEEIRRLFEIVEPLGGVILGGYVRWMCSPRTTPAFAKDVDVYCPDESAFKLIRQELETAQKLTVKNFNDISVSYLVPEHPHLLFSCPQIQLIKPMQEGVIMTQGSREDILKNFDFTVVRVGLTNPSFAIGDPDFLEDELHMRLRIKNIHCPISSMYRVMKYKSKGYFPSTGLILKLFLDWEERTEETRMKILAFYKKLEEDEGSVSKEEIEEMERLMRLID